MNLEPAPRLKKTPFIAVALVCFAAMVLIGLYAPNKFAALPLIISVVLLFISIMAIMVPVLIDYAADSAEFIQEERARTAEHVQRLHVAGESLARAAAQVKAVEEAVHKAVTAAENLPYRMQEKIAEFNQQLGQSGDDERDRLNEEIATLRQGESDRLQTVVDRIHKAATDWAALEVASRQQLAAAEAAITRLQQAAQELTATFETKAQAAANAFGAQGLAVGAGLDDRALAAAHLFDTRVQATVAALEGRVQTAVATLETKVEAAAGALDMRVLAAVSGLSAPLARLEVTAPPFKLPEPAPAEPITAAVAPVAEPDEPTPEPPAEPTAETTAPEPAATEAPDDKVTSDDDLKPAAAGETDDKEEDEEAAAEAAEVEADEAEATIADKAKPDPTAEADETDAEEESEDEDEDEDEAETEDAAPVAPKTEEAASDDDLAETATAELAASSDGATRLLATAYIGIGNKLYIRGDGPGLSRDKGVPMQFVSIGKWGWATHEATKPLRCKLYKNDSIAALTGEVVLVPGKHIEVTALF